MKFFGNILAKFAKKYKVTETLFSEKNTKLFKKNRIWMPIKIVDIDKTYVLSLLQTFFQSLNFKKIFRFFIWLCI